LFASHKTHSPLLQILFPLQGRGAQVPALQQVPAWQG
jgi:hypothetical protein